jgi:hypothetical protein
MKQILLFSLVVALALPALAQESGGSFTAPGTSRELREVRPTPPEKVLRPKTHGVIVMMSEQGLQVISPLAPKELGIGQKVLSPNIAQEGRIGDEKSDRKPFGGIQLIGWVF